MRQPLFEHSGMFLLVFILLIVSILSIAFVIVDVVVRKREFQLTVTELSFGTALTVVVVLQLHFLILLKQRL